MRLSAVLLLFIAVVYQMVSCPPCLPGYYRIGRRSKKWWKRGFWYILDVAAVEVPNTVGGSSYR